MKKELIIEIVDLLVAASNALGENEISDDCEDMAKRLEGMLEISDLEKALKNFKERVGVSLEELTTSEEARTIARKKLEAETERLRRELHI